ncbi:hypothetical protein [Streptomyces sp900116325]|uniref:hypothetical protein n=1 Tax=Streptomyces sp. 900116325 TaxID=3154295 RepID=UPI00331B55F5
MRRHQPRVLPEPRAPTTSITAAVDVPGYVPGSALGFNEITAGIVSRANALKTAGARIARKGHSFRSFVRPESPGAPVWLSGLLPSYGPCSVS